MTYREARVSGNLAKHSKQKMKERRPSCSMVVSKGAGGVRDHRAATLEADL